MTTPYGQIKIHYERQLHTYNQLEEEARFALASGIDRMAVKVHSVTSRTKTLNSVLEKTERKRLQHPFEEINDIVGLRVVCLFMGDIPKIRDVIRNSFKVISEDDKIEGYDAHSFGYMSHHIIVTMKKRYSGPRYAQISNIRFEIQVRTIAMEAWATISHYLDYKVEKDVPKTLRRDFYALAGLFYIADKHFETFYNAGEVARKQLIQAFSSPNPPLDIKITADTLPAYLQAKLPKRDRGAMHSDLVDAVGRIGLTRIRQIDDAFSRGWNAFLQFELDNKDRHSSDVGVAAVILTIVYPKFKKHWGTVGALKQYRKLVGPVTSHNSSPFDPPTSYD